MSSKAPATQDSPSVPASEVDARQLCQACSRFATGVCVATVIDVAGAPHGMTVNSFTSVSLDPPLILFCIDHRSKILEHFRLAQHFAINVLAESQKNVSQHFARSGFDRFDGVEWHRGETGVPLLPGVLATIECRLEQAVRAGDHDILIGRVLHTRQQEGRPLLFYGSSYRELA